MSPEPLLATVNSAAIALQTMRPETLEKSTAPMTPSTGARRIVADQLGVQFPGGVKALADLSFAAAPGEFISVVGPSGCGKSTLLRVLAGSVAASEGAFAAEAKPGADALRLSFVFQQATLLPWRTVAANIALPLELVRRRWIFSGLTPGDRARIATLIELVGLHDFARSFPSQLSGGMQMRASLARALVTQPELLLLDEPFGALDDITRQRLNEELRALWLRDRFTALFVTHNVSEAVFLSQRVLVMSSRPGRIVADLAVPFGDDRPEELRTSAEFAAVCAKVSRALREASA